MIVNPFFHSIDISAFVIRVKVGKRVWTLLNPLMGDDTNISRAEYVLTEDLQAMLCHSLSAFEIMLMSSKLLTYVDFDSERTSIKENRRVRLVLIIVLEDRLAQHV